MASSHEYVEQYGQDNVSLYNTCVYEAIIIDVDNDNDTANINVVTAGIGLVSNVPIFYHCPGSDVVEGGSVAFATDDRVLVLCKGCKDSAIPSSRMKVIGFVDGLKGCGFLFRLEREDGVLITELSGLLDYIDLYNSSGTQVDVTEPSYDGDTEYWFFDLIDFGDRDPNGYWVEYSCEDGCVTQYESKVLPSELRQAEDLVLPGKYEDIISNIPSISIKINGKFPEYTKTLLIIDSNDNEFTCSSTPGSPSTVELSCEIVWPAKIYLSCIGAGGEQIFDYYTDPEDPVNPEGYLHAIIGTEFGRNYLEIGYTLDYVPTGSEIFLKAARKVSYTLAGEYGSIPAFPVSFTARMLGKLVIKNSDFFLPLYCCTCTLTVQTKTWGGDVGDIEYLPSMTGSYPSGTVCINLDAYECATCRYCWSTRCPGLESYDLSTMAIFTDENGNNPVFGDAGITLKYEEVYALCSQAEIKPTECGDWQYDVCESGPATVLEAVVYEWKMVLTPDDRI